MTKVDFHMHSLYSRDGELSPSALIAAAARLGFKALSLTDHNTAAGVREALDAGKAAGIEVITGIEFDCYCEGILFHLLGYGIDPEDRRITEIDRDVTAKSKAAARQIIVLIRNAGIVVEDEEVLSRSSDGVITGELVAEVAFHKPGAEKNPRLVPYLPGGSRSDNPYVNFYWDFCGQGKPAYVAIDYISLDEAVAVINAGGGVPVLAHPGQMLRNREELLPAVMGRGIKGLEAWSSYHSPEENVFYAEQGRKLGVFLTGGSDFHGKAKPPIQMGQFGYKGDELELLKALTGALRN
jgi:predicted metal-dependent phosphoesterase TrpH